MHIALTPKRRYRTTLCQEKKEKEESKALRIASMHQYKNLEEYVKKSKIKLNLGASNNYSNTRRNKKKNKKKTRKKTRKPK